MEQQKTQDSFEFKIYKLLNPSTGKLVGFKININKDVSVSINGDKITKEQLVEKIKFDSEMGFIPPLSKKQVDEIWELIPSSSK